MPGDKRVGTCYALYREDDAVWPDWLSMILQGLRYRSSCRSAHKPVALAHAVSGRRRYRTLKQYLHPAADRRPSSSPSKVTFAHQPAVRPDGEMFVNGGRGDFTDTQHRWLTAPLHGHLTGIAEDLGPEHHIILAMGEGVQPAVTSS